MPSCCGKISANSPTVPTKALAAPARLRRNSISPIRLWASALDIPCTAKLLVETNAAAAFRYSSELARIEHDGPVWAVAFSPDGPQLATASLDNTARLIRADDGREQARIEHGGPVNAVAFSPDSQLLATASGDGALRLKLLPPDLWFSKLCENRLARNFIAEEWQRYIGESEPHAPTCEKWLSRP